MQFQQDCLDHPIYIKSYDPHLHQLTIFCNKDINNNPKAITKKLHTSTIVLLDNIIENWQPSCVQELNTSYITHILSFQPEIIILGIGEKLVPLDYTILEPLYRSKTPFEVMTTINACRTYNLLASEHRKVAAALILSK